MPSDQASALSKSGGSFAVDDAGRLLEIDLYLTFDELAGRLRYCLAAARSASDPVRQDFVLDAFLLAAGMAQILEDYLHAKGWLIRKLAPYVRSRASGLRGAALRGLRLTDHTLVAVRPSKRQLGAVAASAATLAERCASLVSDPRLATEESLLDLESEVQELIRISEKLARGVRRSVVKLAQCFRSFDQHPDDCRLLAHKVRSRCPDLERPLLVVGLRTSGCYLGPLVAAELRAIGYETIRLLTVRPRQRWHLRESAVVRRLVADGGIALLVDDPPRTGNHLRMCAEELRRLGVHDSSILLLLQVLGPESLPPTLADYEALLLPWSEWSIHARLSSSAVEDILRPALSGRTVASESEATSVQVADVRCLRVEDLSALPREHVATRLDLLLSDGTGRQVAEQLAVRGAGLGYLGRHAVAVHERLSDLVPPLYAFAEGMAFSAASRVEERLTPERLRTEPGAAAEIARYVHERGGRLRVGADRTVGFSGREAAWEVAAEMLEAAFGGPRPLVRRLARSTAARLLAVDQPAVVDGDTDPRCWYGRPGALRKTAYAERAFSNRDLASYDPIFDLAGAAAAVEAIELPEVAGAIRESYEVIEGRAVDEERWFLYRLVHHARVRDDLLALGASGLNPAAALDEALRRERAMAKVQQAYLAARYLGDLTPAESGPLCALDIDGVLETWWRRFPALGPAGALALRALNKHGYRVVLVTGRSLEEVEDRCGAYRLAGGVAEYGAVVYDHVRGVTAAVASTDELASLETLRSVLHDVPGTYVDQVYTRSLRAYRVEPPGRRRALSDDAVETALARTDRAVRAVQGRLQTDFIPAAVDKGRGTRMIADVLGANGASAKPLVLAVGDTEADLPFLALAELAFAPAGAADEVKRQTQTTRGSEQRGLAEAVARLLGHEPGGCPVCRPRPLPANARLLLSALAALDSGWLSKAQAAGLLTRLAQGRTNA